VKEKIASLEDLQVYKDEGFKNLFPHNIKIMIGSASCGLASNADEVYDVIQSGIQNLGIDASVVKTGCIGFCQKEPLVDVFIPGYPRIMYKEIDTEKAKELVTIIKEKRIKNGWVLGKIEKIVNIVTDETYNYSVSQIDFSNNGFPSLFEIPFFKKQLKIALRNCGFIEPESLSEYIARGGYYSLYKTLHNFAPDEVIEEITKSGLRGRGGAGFPTGKKWMMCRNSEGDKKYVICNADEGDPGAYMDRSILEGDPFSIIEGMTIGAFAIGADEGVIYVRMEYPLAVEKLSIAIKTAEDKGLLGNNILGSKFNFKILLVRGSGAFVCGEETAMIASIEGRVGEPTQRPPYPVEKGLWGKPTNINNVETWANVPVIISKGHKWFSSIGTGLSKGTKVFSLVGKVKNTGLVEVPMGITLEEIIYDIGEGILRNKKFKAVQTGGPSGGCIPLEYINLPVDYEHLSEVGSIMGSGGMVVMDEDTCMVDIAKYFLSFTRHESCGKCTPCREGTKFMYDILTNITKGRGREQDIAVLEELSQAIIDGSLCGLGGTAPNPVLTTIRHFREEYEKHIREKRCPAMACKDIISTPCKYNCPVDTDVPAFIAYVAKKRYKEAFNIIRDGNPLPIVTGYVCHHPCEEKCRGINDGDPISIKALKRFVGEIEMKRGKREIPMPKVRKKLKAVAIIGSGPAGLAAAVDLEKEGYKVTIFESSPTLGGMVNDAIPRFRLPKKILNDEIEFIKKTGMEFVTNTTVGKDISFDDLFLKGYSAIIIATGAHKSLELGIPGSDVKGVIDGLQFLKDAKLQKAVSLGKVVGVIGIGNTAIDSARTAWRLGCEKVMMIYRRVREEVPAMKPEVADGVAEGIEFIGARTAPVRVISEGGKVTGLACIKIEFGSFDKSGRRKSIPIKDSDFIITLDTLINAVGQEPDVSFLQKEYNIKISKNNTIIVDPETLATNYEGIFAAGDVVTGPSTIADSMAQGKRAAESVRLYLEGKPLQREFKTALPSKYVEPVKLTPEELMALKRLEPLKVSVEKRKSNFNIVVLGYSEAMATTEAKRCLRCDLKEEFERKAL